MSNSVNPDEMAHYYEPSHLDLCCLQKPTVIAYGSERVNETMTVCRQNTWNINISAAVVIGALRVRE